MDKNYYQNKLLWLLKQNQQLNHELNLDLLYVLITKLFSELTQTETCFIVLKDKHTDNLSIKYVYNKDNFPLPKEKEPIIYQNCTRLIETNKPVWDHRNPHSNHKHSSHKFIYLPLLTFNHENLGVIGAEITTDNEYLSDNTYKNLCEIFAGQAATAVNNALLFKRAMNDPLTGLPNNGYFLQQLNKILKELSQCKQTGNQEMQTSPPIHSTNLNQITPSGGVLLLDLDSFKRINIIAGAGIGDKALIDIANALQDILSADGLVARYGSDKFSVLIPPETSDPATTSIDLRLRDAAERARAVITTKIYNNIKLTASVGGITFPRPEAKTAAEIIALTDDTLARARARGHGQIEILV